MTTTKDSRNAERRSTEEISRGFFGEFCMPPSKYLLSFPDRVCFGFARDGLYLYMRCDGIVVIKSIAGFWSFCDVCRLLAES